MAAKKRTKISFYFESEFQKELTALINRYSQENHSDTPDYILAEYLLGCLGSFNYAVNARTKHQKGA